MPSKTQKFDELTVASTAKTVKPAVPRVRICLPLNENDTSGLKVDPYEHVTVNGVTTLIKRGEYVDVTVPVYMQLRNRFPTI